MAACAEVQNPRQILRERTARWREERVVPGEDQTAGAESNPTGQPIGGGKDYTDLVARGHYAVRTYEQLADAMAKAQAGQVVFIPDGVEIDMGGKAALKVPGGVTLASARGQGDAKGALLFSKVGETPGMLMSGGSHIRITGLRLQGPHAGRSRIPTSSNGIRIEHFGCEVDNCEISAFANSGVYVAPGAERAYVHHCDIHHNIRDGLGYGVCINAGTVLIEANRFDHGRHYIASTGAPGSGYEARYNLSGPVSTSHEYDMHGGRDRGDATDIAGDWMDVHHNTFLSKAMAVKVRGVPTQWVRVTHNRFAQGTEKSNVSSGGRTTVSDNVVGPPAKE